MADSRFDPLEMHEKYWPETFDGLLLPFALALHRAHGTHRQYADAVMAKHGLAPAEFDVLATLRRAPPPGELTPSEIQQAMFITSGGLTKVLQQLEAQGLVVRTTSAFDRRSKPVHLTPAAIPKIERAMSELMATMAAAIKERLSETEIMELTCLLNRLQPVRTLPDI